MPDVTDGHCERHFTYGSGASGAVFPTSGQANPTLTIVALTLRLADHLKKRLAPQEGA
jgi:choline dehydrogenase-like flavoprotein